MSMTRRELREQRKLLGYGQGERSPDNSERPTNIHKNLWGLICAAYKENHDTKNPMPNELYAETLREQSGIDLFHYTMKLTIPVHVICEHSISNAYEPRQLDRVPEQLHGMPVAATDVVSLPFSDDSHTSKANCRLYIQIAYVKPTSGDRPDTVCTALIDPDEFFTHSVNFHEDESQAHIDDVASNGGDTNHTRW